IKQRLKGFSRRWYMFTGCGTALVTPFKQDSSLDESTLRNLIRRQIDAGISFLVPCGTTGESPTLTRAEHLRVVEITLEEAKGKVPVLAGAGGYNTHEVIELARELESMGADGILSGDDSITIPLCALGGRGIVSVASNEIPGEMTLIAQHCLDGDFAAARAIQAKYLRLMNVNFIESNPIPVKAAMALMGLLEPV